MEIEKLQEVLSLSYEEVQKEFQKERTRPKASDFLKEYNVSGHEILDAAKRPDKLVETDKGASTVKVARLAAPFQKRIVQMAVTFLCGRPIKINAIPADDTQAEFIGAIQKSWKDNKLDYDTQELARILFSETEVAELWYVEPVEPGYWGEGAMAASTLRLRMRILANSLGDTLDPVFNGAGDMIAFGRGYQIVQDGKKIDCYDVYTETQIIKGQKLDSWVVEPVANTMGKIPVIYYSKPSTEWADVQTLIQRFETLLSNSADNNDYYGNPMIKVKGEVKGFAKKGEQGKIIEISGDGDAEYMTHSGANESVQSEFKMLRSFILDMTDTPDISFENMKGLGTFSGIALKMMFLSSHMKASSNEQIFGKGIQRRLNLMKAGVAKINITWETVVPMLTLEPKFEYFIPEDVEGMIDTLMLANGNKAILSQKTAVSLNPLVNDPEQELANITEEADAAVPPLA